MKKKIKREGKKRTCNGKIVLYFLENSALSQNTFWETFWFVFFLLPKSFYLKPGVQWAVRTQQEHFPRAQQETLGSSHRGSAPQHKEFLLWAPAFLENHSYSACGNWPQPCTDWCRADQERGWVIEWEFKQKWTELVFESLLPSKSAHGWKTECYKYIL